MQPVYGANLADGRRVIVGLSEELTYTVARKAEVHAYGLLRYLDTGLTAGSWIIGVQLQAYYRGWLILTNETPVPWNSLAAELRRITGQGKKTYRLNGKRHPIFFIPHGEGI